MMGWTVSKPKSKALSQKLKLWESLSYGEVYEEVKNEKR